MDSAKGARVRIVRGDSTVADLVQGNRGPSLDGGYFRAAGDSAVYLVGGDLAQALEQSSDEWRDQRIAGVAAGQRRPDRGEPGEAIVHGAPGWRPAGRGARVGGRTRAAVAALLAGYRQVEAAGFATAAQADSASFARPDRRAALLRADGTPLLTLAFDSTANGFWVRAGEDSTVYRMDTWSADRLTGGQQPAK